MGAQPFRALHDRLSQPASHVGVALEVETVLCRPLVPGLLRPNDFHRPGSTSASMRSSSASISSWVMKRPAVISALPRCTAAMNAASAWTYWRTACSTIHARSRPSALARVSTSLRRSSDTRADRVTVCAIEVSPSVYIADSITYFILVARHTDCGGWGGLEGA